MLITANETCYNYVVIVSVVLLIISIDPRGITPSSFHGYSEAINKKVGNIYWFFQGTFLVEYQTSECMLSILQCC